MCSFKEPQTKMQSIPDNKYEISGKARWSSIILYALLIGALYSLITGGGINFGFSNDRDVHHLDNVEVFPGCRLFLQVSENESGKTFFAIPFLLTVLYMHDAQDLRIIINNMDSNGEDFTLKINRISLGDSSLENTVLINQTFKLSKNIKFECIHLSNVLPKNESTVLVRIYGTAESEKNHDEQEFVFEYKIVIHSKEFFVFSGWPNILDSYLPPSLGGP